MLVLGRRHPKLTLHCVELADTSLAKYTSATSRPCFRALLQIIPTSSNPHNPTYRIFFLPFYLRKNILQQCSMLYTYQIVRMSEGIYLRILVA